MKRKLLLHACCGPCAAGCLDALAGGGWGEVTLYFSNANVEPADEYALRLEAMRDMAARAGLPLIEDGYEPAAWRAACAGLEGEPEGGARCDRCFRFRLARAAAMAAERGCDAFATTLTVSPRKDSARIFAVGAAWPAFQPLDFKKGGGFARGMALARAWGLYRQRRCGCAFAPGAPAR